MDEYMKRGRLTKKVIFVRVNKFFGGNLDKNEQRATDQSKNVIFVGCIEKICCIICILYLERSVLDTWIIGDLFL